MKRIGVFTKPLDNWISGSGHHLNEMLSHALDLNDRNPRFDFTFIHYEKSENPIYRRARELIIPRTPLFAAAVLRRYRFDVLHHGPLTIFSPIFFSGGKKRMATIHGAEQLITPELYGPITMAHEEHLVPFYARRMDAIVTVSQTSKAFFAERFRVRPERVTVCYNGLSPAYKRLEAAEIRAPSRLGLSGDYILHLSRFSERKNPWTMLAAFARLRERDARSRSFSLVCAGKGWDSAEVRARAEALGFGDAFFAPGFVDQRTGVELMNGARAFLFPSLAEGFGMPNIEAMACSCPVVTSRIFAIPEIVGDAAVVLDDPKDTEAMAEALARVCFDQELRGRLVQAGQARLPLFTWEESAAKLMAVYEELTR